MLVVGATYPRELAEVRAIVGDMPLLVPGVGAQGGDVAQAVHNGQTATGTGLVISSSRAILYASSGDGFRRRGAQGHRDAARPDQCQPRERGEPPHVAASRCRRSLACVCALLAGCSRAAAQPGRRQHAPARKCCSAATAPSRIRSIRRRRARIESQTILRDLCEGLTTLAKDASVAPGVAREWDVSDDGKTYTFQLRPRRAGRTAIRSSPRISSRGCGGWSIPRRPRNTRRSSRSS